MKDCTCACHRIHPPGSIFWSAACLLLDSLEPRRRDPLDQQGDRKEGEAVEKRKDVFDRQIESHSGHWDM
jgi:hypothetical protein